MEYEIKETNAVAIAFHVIRMVIQLEVFVILESLPYFTFPKYLGVISLMDYLCYKNYWK